MEPDHTQNKRDKKKKKKGDVMCPNYKMTKKKPSIYCKNLDLIFF